MSRQLRATIVALLAVGGVHRASAAEPSAEGTRGEQFRWGLKGDLTFLMWGDRAAPAYVAPGLTLEGMLGRHLFAEFTFAAALSSTVATDRGTVNVDPDFSLRFLIRPSLPLDDQGLHFLYAGLGPLFISGGVYRTLWQAYGELGYEFRSPRRFSLLFAAGSTFALQDRPWPAALGHCIAFSCDAGIRGGARTTTLRAAAGLNF